MWEIKKNIATYRTPHLCMVTEIKIVEDPVGLYKTENEIVYMDEVKNPMLVARAMRELGETMGAMGADKLMPYTYRICEWCGEEFLKKSEDKVICSGKCKTQMSRVRSDIKSAEVTEDDNFRTIVKFKNGKFVDDVYYDNLKYKDTTCKIFYINELADDEDIVEFYRSLNRDNLWEYRDIDNESVVIFDKKGSVPNHTMMSIYDMIYEMLLSHPLFSHK